MPDADLHIISSAVVSVMPGRREAVVEALAGISGAEVRAAAGSKIVVILEGADRGEVGGRLLRIADLDGVVSANMVFEHVETDTEVPT
jgi:nitrate reductase NapD